MRLHVWADASGRHPAIDAVIEAPDEDPADFLWRTFPLHQVQWEPADSGDA
jgi:hypothetical protein